MRSSSDRLGLRFFRWVCSVEVLTEAGEGRGVGSRDCDEADPSGGGPVCVLALEGKEWIRNKSRMGRDALDTTYQDLRCAVHFEMLKPPVSSSRIDTPSSQTSQITRPDSYSLPRMEAGRSLSFIDGGPKDCRVGSGGGRLFWG